MTNQGIYLLGGTAGDMALLAFNLDSAAAVPSLGSIAGGNLNANLLADIIEDGLMTFAVGAESANAIAVTVQLKNPNNANPTGARVVTVWIFGYRRCCAVWYCADWHCCILWHWCGGA
jgi:hypothetical protein